MIRLREHWPTLLVIFAVCSVPVWLVHYPWLLVVLVIFICMSLTIPRLRRARYLKHQGYFLLWGHEGASSYEEIADSSTRVVPLPSRWTESGRSELFIPTQAEWALVAPEWASRRRDEIFRRVVSIWNGADIHYPPDWPAESQNNQQAQVQERSATN